MATSDNDLPEHVQAKRRCYPITYLDKTRLNWAAARATSLAWIRLFSETGFAIEDYLELVAPREAQGSPLGVSAEWARNVSQRAGLDATQTGA